MSDYKYQCLDCFKTYIGPQLPGKMACNCVPSKAISGVKVVKPLSDALLREISSGEAATMRSAMCTRWQITNKSHVSHGSNFSSNQKVVNLILDIVNPVRGTLRATVRAAVIAEYGFDIDTQEMA